MIHEPRRELVARCLLAAAAVGLLVLVQNPLAVASSTTTTDPGRLAQTTTEPAFDGALARQMDVVWRAILRDDVALGRTVFFPESAYVRMKTGLLASPRTDYTDRLIGFYDLDLAAY